MRKKCHDADIGRYRDILQEALRCAEPCIIEVVTDAEQNFSPKSSSKVMPDGRITSPSLDDMALFLPREEFKSIRYVKGAIK